VRTGMNQHHRLFRSAWLQLTTLGILGTLMAGCGGSDGFSPSTEFPLAGVPADSALGSDSISAVPIDSTLPADSASIVGFPGEAALSAAPGIMFGTFSMKTDLLGTIHTGSFRSPGPSNVIELLTGARAKGARIVMQMTGGHVEDVKNSDGTFNLTKWKAKVAGFRNVAFGSFITDGTILVHYLIDEPNNPSKWGGKIVPQATIEAMAQYSKQLWPTMITLARVDPSWLASSPVNYVHLDAGWAQYRSSKGDPTKFITTQVAAARSKALGAVVGLNVLNGGNGSSGIRGTKSGEWKMSASELRNYGTILLNQSYACGFMMWTYDATYYGRSDIKSAMTDLSAKARAHVKTSCRQ
jgi:hypothetical protein